MKTHTLRGRLDARTNKRLIVDDGRFTSSMVVKEFYVWAKSVSSSEDPECFLSKQPLTENAFDASDGRQIAWASQTTSATSRVMNFSVVDPEHVIIQDLYIRNIADTEQANYLIVLEEQNLTEDQAVLQLIKEVSQDVN